MGTLLEKIKKNQGISGSGGSTPSSAGTPSGSGGSLLDRIKANAAGKKVQTEERNVYKQLDTLADKKAEAEGRTYLGGAKLSQGYSTEDKITKAVEKIPIANSLWAAFQSAKETVLDTSNRLGGFIETLPANGTKFVDNAGNITESNNTVTERAGKAGEAAVGLANLAFAPITAAFAGAEKLPVVGKLFKGVGWVFGKIGEGGSWVGDKTVDALPISEQAKADLRPLFKDVGGLAAQYLGGKGASKLSGKAAPIIKEKAGQAMNAVTKDVITQQGLPQSVYMDAVKIRDLFREGGKNVSITPDEARLVRSLGLDGKGYKEALRNGLQIEIPAETVIKLMDKPWFQKAKGLLNIASEETIIQKTGGSPTGRPIRGYIEAADPNYSVPKTPPIQERVIKNAAPEVLTTSPISSAVLDRIRTFSPQEASAFGRKIIDGVKENTGIKLNDKNTGVVEMVKGESPDGRPAEYIDGKIKFYPDAFAADLEMLSQGKTIIAHSFDKQPVVYKLKDGESMNELATRYFKDVLVHELAHGKTIGPAEIQATKDLQNALVDAIASNDQKAIAAAQTAIDKQLLSLENTANEYMRANREALEAELFPEGKTNKKFEDAVTGKEAPKKIVTTEKKLLTKKIKDQNKGAKEAVKVERKSLTEQIKNVIENTKSRAERNAALGKLKQRIQDRSAFQAAISSVRNFFESKKEQAARRQELSTLKKGIQMRSRYEATIEDIKSRFLDVAAKRKLLIEYTDLLPASERGKFIRRINSVSSEKQMLKTIESMRTAADLVQRKLLKKEIEKEIKDATIRMKDGLPEKGSVKFEKQALMQLIKIKAGIRGDYAAAQERADNIIVKAAEENRPLTDAEFKQIQMDRMVGMKDMNARELRNLLDNIKSLKETGRMAKELERLNREADDQRIIDGAQMAITGGQKVPSADQLIQRRKRPATIKEVLSQAAGDFFIRGSFGFEDMLDKISVLDKGSKAFQSVINNKIGRPIKNAFKEEYTATKKQTEALHKIVTESYKIKSQKEWNALADSLNQKIQFGKVKDFEGVEKNFEMTKGEAIDAYMKMQDSTLLESLEVGNKFTEEIMQKIENSLSAEDKALAQGLLQMYKEMHPAISDAFEKEFGIDLPFSENYSPVKRYIEFEKPEQTILAQEAQRYASTKNASLKSRTSSKAPIEFKNPIETAMNYVVRMEHYKAFSEPIRLARKVFNNNEIKEAIREFHNPKDLTTITGFLDDFARGGVDQAKIIPELEKIRSNVTSAILGVNAHVAISQLAGIVNYAIDASPTDVVFGLKDFFSAPIKNATFLVENSPVLQERFGDGYTEEIKLATSRDAFDKIADIRPLKDKLFIFSRNMDKLTVVTGAWISYSSKYKELKAQGVPEKEAVAKAIEYAEDITLRTQESSRLDTKSSIQRSGSLAKLFVMFASQPIKMNRIIMGEIRNARAGRTPWKTAIKRVAIAWFFSQLAYQFIANRDAGTGEKFLNALLSPLTNALVMGNLVQSIIGWSYGKPYDYSPSAVFSAVEDIRKIVQNIGQDDMGEAITYFTDLLGKGTGIPTKIITKPIRKGLKEE